MYILYSAPAQETAKHRAMVARNAAGDDSEVFNLRLLVACPRFKVTDLC